MQKTINFAKAILLAQKLREESFDKKAAEQCKDKYINYNSFYKLDTRQASIKACKQSNISENYGEPIDYLIRGYWNDIHDWAKEQIV